MKHLVAAIAVTTSFLVPTQTHAGPVEDVSAILTGRSGSASEDRRGETKVLGVKVDCPGDTLEANIRINGVSGSQSGDTVYISVTYSGEYTRQGWGGGCNRLPGAENGQLNGSYSFSLTGKAFQRPTLTWGTPSGLGSISNSSTHDSNVFAIRAVQGAVSSAF